MCRILYCSFYSASFYYQQLAIDSWSFAYPPYSSIIPITCKALNSRNQSYVIGEFQLAAFYFRICYLCLDFNTSYIISFLSFRGFSDFFSLWFCSILNSNDPFMPFIFAFRYLSHNFAFIWTKAQLMSLFKVVCFYNLLKIYSVNISFSLYRSEYCLNLPLFVSIPLQNQRLYQVLIFQVFFRCYSYSF